jgi:hypothetical protein
MSEGHVATSSFSSLPAALPAKSLRGLAFLLALILLNAALFYQCFCQREIVLDERVLHNSVYMSLHFGKVSAPAQGEFSSLTVHPPSLYYLVAKIMGFDPSVLRAAGLLSVSAFAFFCLLVLFSKFPFPVQIGCLFGAFVGAFIWNQALLLRPDLMLTLTWLTGLVALETARLDNWNQWRLMIGGMFMILPASMHYLGGAACGALPLIALWIWKTADPRQRISRIMWLLGGASIIAIPSLFLIFIPHLREIVSVARWAGAQHPDVSSYSRHLEAYALWHQGFSAAFRTRPVVTLLTDSLFRFLTPAAFAAPVLLALVPSTRGMAVAAAPYLFFLLFGARHKQVDYTGYFAPEVTLYLIALTTVIASAFFFAVQRVNRRWLTISAGVAATAVLAIGALRDIPAIVGGDRRPTRGVYDLENARAAGRGILGPDAVVGATGGGLWFTSGADTFYNLGREILNAPSVEPGDLRRYFAAFDAIVMDAENSWVAYNRQRANITNAYLNGTLHARGFYFGDRRLSSESSLSYMVYTERPIREFAGYALKENTIYRFQPDAQGGQVFASAVCSIQDSEGAGFASNSKLGLDFYLRLFKPLPPSSEPSEHSAPSAAIVNFVADRRRFDVDIRPQLDKCTIRDQIPGKFIPAEIMVFRRESEVNERAIRFPQSFGEVEGIGKSRFQNGCACDPAAGAQAGDGSRAQSKQ